MRALSRRNGSCQSVGPSNVAQGCDPGLRCAVPYHVSCGDLLGAVRTIQVQPKSCRLVCQWLGDSWRAHLPMRGGGATAVALRTTTMNASPNHWLQATPGFAWLFIQAHSPGLPEPSRSAWYRFAFGEYL